MLTKDKVAVKDIRADGIQARVKCSEDRIEKFSELMKTGQKFPPVVVFVDEKGRHWIGDGWHRYLAALKAGIKHIDADVRPGDQMEAMLFNIQANRDDKLALSLTDGDKSRACRLLWMHPDWKSRTAREVAEFVGCSEGTAFIVRKKLALEGQKFENAKSTSNQNAKRGTTGARVNRVLGVAKLSAEGRNLLEISREAGVNRTTVCNDLAIAKARGVMVKCECCNGTGWRLADDDGRKESRPA